MATKFPIGGPKQAVFDALTDCGFRMDSFGDKQWTRAVDGLRAHIYGSGSMLRVYRGKELVIDAPIAEALASLK